MAISLGSIVVELLANTASFQSGMTKASYEGKKAAKEIHQSFSEMGNKIGSAAQNALASLGQFGAVAGELARGVSEAFEGIGKGGNGISLAVGALGGLAAAGIAAAAGLLELGKSGAELVEHLSQVSQKTGIGIRDLQIFEAAGSTVRVSLDDMVIGLRKFDQALLNTGKGAAAQGILKELGVTARDNKEALLQTADAFAKMDDGARKNSDAVALFGKSGLQLIPFLNKGRDGILELEAAVDKFGPKIGKDQVEALEKNKAAVAGLSLQWDKFKVDAETNILPVLTKLTTWFNDHGGFSAVLAGLAGGRGAAAILKEQQASQEAATNAAKQESAAKDDSLRKQEKLNNSLKENFEVLKLGGAAAFALSQARLELEGAVQNGLWKQASAIQAQLPELQKAADLEAQRVARAKQLAASYASLQESFAKGGASPLFKSKPTDLTKGTEALFGPQPKNPLEGAPDLGQPDFLKNAQAMPDLLKDGLNLGKAALDEFYADWNKQSKGTVESINAIYDKQWQHFDGLFALGEITEEQFKDVSLKIERERQEGLKTLRQDTGASTFRDAWQDMFREIENSGRDFARSITADIGNAIQNLNQQLSQFVVTGKGLNFKQIGQSLEANLFGSILRKGESSLAGSLGNLFGLGNGAKPDGSTASKALFVQMAGVGGLSAAGVGSLPLGGLASLFGLGGTTTTGTTTPAKSSGGFLSGFGSVLGGIASLFGGFLADGGDAQPGRAYVIGEKRPELFIPRSAGTVVPHIPNGDSHKHLHVTNELHVHGVTDADSFKRSQNQIMNTMTRAQQRAASR
jgi:hypothetical protein